MRSGRMLFFLKILISSALLALLWNRVDFYKLQKAFAACSLWVILAGNIIHALAFGINVLKWRLFLPGYPLSDLFRYNLISKFYSLILPGQFSGDIVKAVVASPHRYTREHLTASIFYDKLSGLAGMLLLSFIAILLSSIAIPPMAIAVVAVFFVGVVVTMMYGSSIPLVMVKWHQRSPIRPFPFLLTITKFLEKSARAYPVKEKRLIYSIILGILYQLVGASVVYWIARDIGVLVPIWDWFWILGGLSIILLIPVTIAGLGVRECGLIGILSLFSIPAEKAIVLSLIILGLQVFLALIGLCVEGKRIIERT